MPLVPNDICATITPAQRQAIGALCYDAGVSTRMSYTAAESTTLLDEADNSLVSTFKYSNSIFGCAGPSGIAGPNLMDMVNPNLDYGHPVILDIASTPGDGYAHAIVADGYGYELSTLYHHLNMGKQGNSDAWYNLPNVGSYIMVRGCVYNVFTSGSGEIISGRVTNAYRNPVSDVNVTAQRTGGGTYVATTNNSGIYALAHVPSASAYTITAAKSGYSFVPADVNTGTSQDLNSVSGNVWGVDFREVPPFVYVDANATGSNDGRSWANAYNHLQDAIAGLCPDVIWVAKGTYYPDRNSANPSGSGSRTATFQLKSGVAIYGGFAGGETSLNQRDPTANVTILSGDIGTPGNNSDNSCHVVTGSGTDPTAILDGFTITDGNAVPPSIYFMGGGMYNNTANPTVANCIFTANSALLGGGMYNEFASPTLTDCSFSTNSAGGGAGMLNIGSNPTLTDCSFSTNSAAHGGGMYNGGSNPTLTNCTFSGNSALGPDKGGGGMANLGGSSPMVTNCTFTGNSAEYAGGGIYNEFSNPTVSDCAFSENSANNYGGGMYRIDSDYLLTLTNCTFNGNSAVLDGGGMYNTDSYDLELFNCTFSGNSAGNYGGGFFEDGTDMFVVNCILWGNTANFGPQIALLNTDMLIAFSDVQGGEASIYKENSSIMYGPFNIEAEPMFVDANDFHLLPDSPCIDAGDNGPVPGGVTTDLDGRPRFVDGDCNDTVIVDMGAYEFAYAYIGDFDGECDVDFVDFAIFALAWLTEQGQPQYNPACDIGIPADSYIGWRDLDVLSDNWLAGK